MTTSERPEPLTCVCGHTLEDHRTASGACSVGHRYPDAQLYLAGQARYKPCKCEGFLNERDVKEVTP